MIEVTPYISPCTKQEDPSTKKLHLRITKPVTYTTHDVAQSLSHSSTYTPADVHGLVSALRDYIIDALSQGHSVQLDGLGRFSAIPHFTKDVLPNEKFRNADIETKAVQFKPERDFLMTVRHLSKYHAGELHQTKNISLAEVMLFCQEWFTTHEVLITTDLMRELQLKRSRAGRMLRELVRRNKLTASKYGTVVQYRMAL